MRIIGLDLSLTGTGMAIFENGDLHWQLFGTSATPPKGSSSLPHHWPFERIGTILTRVKSVCLPTEGSPPALVAIENQFQGMRGSSAVQLAQLGALVSYWLWMQKIPFLGVDNAQLRKFAIGSGATSKSVEGVKMKIPTKELTIANVRERWGHHVSDNNEADATVLAYIAASVIGQWELTISPQREVVAALTAKNPWLTGLRERAKAA